MRPLAIAHAVVVAALPLTASAQSAPELRLPERLDEALRDMMDEMKPALDDALDLMRSFGGIDDPRHYQFPEVLPNGDIIIRRRPDAPEFAPDDPEPAPSVPPESPSSPEEGVRI